MPSTRLDIIINGQDKASGPLGRVTGALGGMAKIAGGVLMAQGIQKTVGFLTGLASASIDAASDLSETANKINVVFGDAAGSINDFASGAAAALGQSQQQALDAAATFGVFGKSAGLAGVDLSGFSSKMTGLASDLASFYNAEPEEAIQALGAALRGESEPIRRFGVLLDDATLRQKAFEMGLISSTKNALTPAQKVLASYEVIMAQTADAQGDFAKTSDGLANKQRINAAIFADLKTKIGEGLLPAMTALQTIVGQLATAFGPLIVGLVDKLGPALAPIVAGVQQFVDQLVAGQGVFPSLMEMLDNFMPDEVIEAIWGGYDAFSQFAAVVQTFVTETLIPFVQEHWEALKGALIAVGALLAAGAIVAGIASIAAVIASLMNPITLIVGAVALLGAAWATNWGGIQDKTKAVIDFVKPFVITAIETVRTTIENVLTAIRAFWAANGDAILAKATAIWNGIYKGFQFFATSSSCCSTHLAWR